MNIKEKRRDILPNDTPKSSVKEEIFNQDKDTIFRPNTFYLSNFIFDFSFEETLCKAQHISVFFWIINRANKSGWKKDISISTDLSLEASGVGCHKTFTKVLQDLHDWGIIEWKIKAKNQYNAVHVISICFDKCYEKKFKALTEADVMQSPITEQSSINANLIFINNKTNKPENLTNNKTKAESKNNILSSGSCKPSSEICRVLDYFNCSYTNIFIIRKLESFFNILVSTGELNVFEENFTNYKLYKNLSNEYIHSIDTFLGNENNRFSDGIWKVINFRKKLEMKSHDSLKTDIQNEKSRKLADLELSKKETFKYLSEP